LPSAAFVEVEYFDDLNAFTDVLAIFAMRKIGIIKFLYFLSEICSHRRYHRYIDSYKGIEIVAI